MKCPQCEKDEVRTFDHLHKFMYGSIRVEVELPVRECYSCGFTYLDHVGHDAKDRAIRDAVLVALKLK